VNVDANATTLRLDVYVPTQKPWASDPGTISILGKNEAPVGRAQLKAGAQAIQLPLPPRNARDGRLQIRLVFSGAKVPKDFGVNADIRNLSAIVSRISTK